MTMLKRFEFLKFQCRAFLHSNEIHALVVIGSCAYQIVYTWQIKPCVKVTNGLYHYILKF
ncbi:hypothetical protein ES332_D01G162200v1 [Gossypium tomentosum]|uniref:Uncharacterized protein n=1 Tax=Gossypium tomentosum TaxID=34277 RepID=A0A5D2M9X7_GOSTO|nr:hypothetical protein ES332_D01G162200v1 [Gossypium tomentosum]